MSRDSHQKLLDRVERLTQLAVDQEGTPEGNLAREMLRRLLKKNNLKQSDLVGEHPTGIAASLRRRQRWKGNVVDLIAWGSSLGSVEKDGYYVVRGSIVYAAQAIHEMNFFCALIEEHAARFERACQMSKEWVAKGQAFPGDKVRAAIEYPWESFTTTAVMALMERYAEDDEEASDPDMEARDLMLQEMLDEAKRDDDDEEESGDGEEDGEEVSDRKQREDEAEEAVDTDWVDAAYNMVLEAQIPPRAAALIGKDAARLTDREESSSSNLTTRP